MKSKDTRLLNRREFNGLCVALSSFVTASGAWALGAATGVASTDAGRTVKFRDGTSETRLSLDYAAAAFNHSCASRVETPAEPPSRPSRIGAVEGIV